VVNADAANKNTVVQFNPVTQLPIKLAGSHNFSLWKAQVSMLMRGHDIYGHLDGTTPAPSQTISSNNQTVDNPAYLSWFRQDQLIQNAILASVDPTLAASVASATSSKAAWDALHIAYANKSQTRIFSLRDRLARLAKNALPVADYMHQVRSLCDELATAGAPVSNEELIVKILTGLGSDFKEFSAAIRARDTTISYEELYEKLLDHELFLKHHDTHASLSNSITAAIAQRSTAQPRSNTNNKRSNNSNNNQPNRGQPWKPHNHLVCQLCDRPGHSARVCRSQSHNHFQARANFGGCQSQQQPSWIIDTGATHHIASDAQSLATAQDYHGPEEIVMCNGTTIPISQTGNTELKASNYRFTLSKTLCSPAIKNNLISVSQFCRDNNTSMEFFPFSYLVKDL
ncbi:hypothetical protein A4A49_62966, partial [Nicotiana attenuata]